MSTGWTTATRGAAAVLAVTGGLAMAGCGAGPADLMQPTAQHATNSGSAGASPSATPSTAHSTPMAPLTGLPAASPRAAGRPAIAVPVSGDQSQGLSGADLVFECSSPATAAQ
jgi:hypothetical protein